MMEKLRNMIFSWLKMTVVVFLLIGENDNDNPFGPRGRPLGHVRAQIECCCLYIYAKILVG